MVRTLQARVRHVSPILFLGLLVLAGDLRSSPVNEEEEPLVVGIFPRRNVETSTNYFRPLIAYMETALRREVRLLTPRDFKSFWRGVKARRYDLVHYNQYHYIQSHKHHGYTAIVKIEEFGQDTIAGALVVRRDSGIDSVADLKGKKIVFGGGPMAMQAYIIPTYILKKSGLEAKDYQSEFALNPPGALYAVYHGLADAGGVGAHILSLPTIKQQIKTSELKVLTRHEHLPHLPWAIKNDMPEALKAQVKSLLLGMNETQAGRAVLAQARLSAFRAVEDSEYDPHRNIIREVFGEDL